jgi:hypothetical protein
MELKIPISPTQFPTIHLSYGSKSVYLGCFDVTTGHIKYFNIMMFINVETNNLTNNYLEITATTTPAKRQKPPVVHNKTLSRLGSLHFGNARH